MEASDDDVRGHGRRPRRLSSTWTRVLSDDDASTVSVSQLTSPPTTDILIPKPSTHRRRRRDATVELSRVGGVYTKFTTRPYCLVEAEQICQQRVELRRVGRIRRQSS